MTCTDKLIARSHIRKKVHTLHISWGFRATGLIFVFILVFIQNHRFLIPKRPASVSQGSHAVPWCPVMTRARPRPGLRGFRATREMKTKMKTKIQNIEENWVFFVFIFRSRSESSQTGSRTRANGDGTSGAVCEPLRNTHGAIADQESTVFDEDKNEDKK